jgi:outer membrane scaffolding protein for murein synthesis (MipA/OmpV family)
VTGFVLARRSAALTRFCIGAVVACASSVARADGPIESPAETPTNPSADAPANARALLPLWEAGAGLGTLVFPAYKGSATVRTFTAPLPYFVYRGETLHANRDGVGLSVLGTQNWKLDLSLSGGLPVESSGTRRNGMRDLPLVGEAGPVLKYNLLDRPGEQVQLRVPLRYATGLHVHGLERVGWISDPGVWVAGKIPGLGAGWDWGASVNLDFQSASYNNFYYGVGAANVTPTRAQYLAKGGYSGADLRVGIVRRYRDFIFSGFVGVSDIAGATFGDSPLVERTANLYAGVAVIWVFKKSAQSSRVRDYGDQP